jgi:hypothetical protein
LSSYQLRRLNVDAGRIPYAHCVTVLNIALAAITDATEARAINKLLG